MSLNEKEKIFYYNSNKVRNKNKMQQTLQLVVSIYHTSAMSLIMIYHRIQKTMFIELAVQHALVLADTQLALPVKSMHYR